MIINKLIDWEAIGRYFVNWNWLNNYIWNFCFAFCLNWYTIYLFVSMLWSIDDYPYICTAYKSGFIYNMFTTCFLWQKWNNNEKAKQFMKFIRGVPF